MILVLILSDLMFHVSSVLTSQKNEDPDLCSCGHLSGNHHNRDSWKGNCMSNLDVLFIFLRKELSQKSFLIDILLKQGI